MAIHTHRSQVCLCVLVVVLATGCSDASVNDPSPAAPNGSGGAGGGPAAQVSLSLPFFVNAPGNYVKSGFMGDGVQTTVAAPSELNPDGSCADSRASASAGGDCDTFTVNPVESGMGWQGVFYQFPAGNWGTLPGRSIASGATEVAFSARASRAVTVKFQVGMCNPEDASQCADGFDAYPTEADVSHKVSVGSSWTALTIDSAEVDYSGGVRGALSWSIANEDLDGDLGEVSLYLDDMAWR